MVNPNFMKLASSMDVHGIRVTSREELPAKMKEFLEYPTDKPVLMECMVTKTEHVFPMVCPPARRCLLLADYYVHQVPAGKALHEQLLHPLLRKSD